MHLENIKVHLLHSKVALIQNTFDCNIILKLHEDLHPHQSLDHTDQ